ncbi:HlyIII-domain-containing protein [Rhizoclosmatium globosum]|uniref:HlyIII-domain-containing protein n=1 Tax=Rhizoclosmatium globosum TaxID=329046 RepID=A0A1Y2CDH1_9FUNG|nr:HlyIII-domain-containing protein [Rhizoclosmatium globosum]|eukprot:ORY45072.1 HlyIII-domain-containing protein [Rhizoclosmatium globosum]
MTDPQPNSDFVIEDALDHRNSAQTLIDEVALTVEKEKLSQEPPSQPLNRWTKPTLLKRDAMPEWYQHEYFIWTGYRPITGSTWDCLYSITYLHNETGNIWTHGLGALIFILLTGYTWGHLFREDGLTGVNWRDHLIALELHIGVISCLFFSAVFHTMCCHSQTVHRSCLKADYVGIVLHIGGCFVASIYYCFYCEKTLQTIYLSLIISFGAAVIFTNVSKRFMKREYARLRLGFFIGFGFWGIIPIIHSCLIHSFQFTQRSIGLNYIFIVALFDFGGAMIVNFRIPERFIPGSFDYIGQSHQIMHICIVLGAITHYLGFIEVFKFWHVQNGVCALSWDQMDVGVGSTMGW